MIHVEGLETPKLRDWLWGKHRIMTTPIMHAEFNGLRITPSIYTTPAEIDLFVDRVRMAIRHGLS